MGNVTVVCFSNEQNLYLQLVVDGNQSDLMLFTNIKETFEAFNM